MKKHVVSRIPSPFSKTAPVKLGDTPPKCKGGPTTSMPLSPRGSLIPQISTGTPKGFEAPYRTYMGSPSPPVEPPVSPRSKSQIPTLASSKPTPLRASHDSFFIRSGATRGKSPKRETEKQARKSQERSTPTVKKSKENGDSIKDKSAGDRKGYVAMNDDVVLHHNHQLPQSIRGTLKISSVDEEHISEDVTEDVIESTEDECIPRPPRRFRDSVTPEPSPRASPVPVLEDYIKEVKINNSEVKIPSFIVNPKPRFLLKDPPKKERSAAVGEVESDKPVQEIPIKAEVKESPNQDATRCNLETKTPNPLKKPTPVEEVAEVRRFTRSDFEKSSSRSPPGTLPKPLLPLILKARPTVQKESPSPEQEKVECTRAEPPRPGTGEVLTPSDLLSSPTDLRRRAPGLTLGMDRKGSLDNFRERPMLGQIGVSSSFSQLSSVKDAECRSISPASSVNSSFGGLGSSGGSLKRGMSMPEAFSSPRECSPIQRDSKHPIWFVNPDLPGYVGFANLPNQVHRKSVKKGFEFTLLVVGESGLGKSTLINSLFLSDLYPDRKIPNAQDKIAKTVSIEASAVEIEERGVKLRLTVVDTPGFGDSISNTDSFKNVIKYIDDQFDKFLNDESGLNRRNIVDNRVHCCFYFINPAGHGLKPLDVAFMKAVDHKVNIVPVISKADTMTLPEIRKLKRKIMDEIDRFGIQIYTLPDCDDDEDDDFKEQCRMLKEAVPFAVVGSTQTIEVRGRKVRGRLYPWGVVEVENPDHCDFIKLRTMLITHMQDLQEVTQEVHYENFRGDRLSGSGERKKIRDRRGSSDIMEKEEKMSQKEVELAKKEAELRKMQEMLTRMQHEMQKQKPPPSAPAPSTGPAPTQLNNNSAKPVNGAALNSRMNGAPPPPPSSRPPAPQ